MPKRFYQFLILALLGSFLLFSVWSAYRATNYGAQITDRDYYNKGLRYNSTILEKRAASVLGWQLDAELQGQQLQLKLSDGKGNPVAGAQGQLVFFQKANANTSLALIETTPGLYLADLPPTVKGEVAVRVDFEYAGARLNRQLLLNI